MVASKIKVSGQNPDTRDIIHAICQAVPVAYSQINEKDFIKIGNTYQDGLNIAKWINKNINYRADGYEEQNIQLPQKLLRDYQYSHAIADCKSFALLFLSICAKLGYKCGLRFASYNVNKRPTHVYNFIIDEKGKKITFDACVKSLKENKRYTYIKDMEINYLNGVPIMTDSEIDSDNIGRLFKKRDKSKPGVFKKVALAPSREAIKGLILLNFRGWATGLKKSNKEKVKSWFLSLGGNPDKIFSVIDRGARKKPLFGAGKLAKGIKGVDDEYEYIGIDPATATLMTAAATIIPSLIKLLKGEGQQVDESGLPEAEPLGDFAPSDPEPEAKGFVEKRTERILAQGPNITPSSTGGINPMLLIGGAVAIGFILFMNKKK